MPIDEVSITYSSPPPKRKLARAIAVVSLIVLAICLWSLVSSYRERKAKGYHPLPASSLVTLVAPLALLGIGLWIGWGQTRIDVGRGTVVRRPLGLPFPAKTTRFAEADGLYVGFYRGPSTVVTPNAGVLMSSGDPGVFWFVRLEGAKFKTMLIVQRSYKDAVEFANELGQRTRLVVEIADPPQRSA